MLPCSNHLTLSVWSLHVPLVCEYNKDEDGSMKGCNPTRPTPPPTVLLFCMGIIFLSNSGASLSHDLLNALDDWSLIGICFIPGFIPCQGDWEGFVPVELGHREPRQRGFVLQPCPFRVSTAALKESRKQHLQSSVNKLFSVDLRRWKSCWALFFSFFWFFTLAGISPSLISSAWLVIPLCLLWLLF